MSEQFSAIYLLYKRKFICMYSSFLILNSLGTEVDPVIVVSIRISFVKSGNSHAKLSNWNTTEGIRTVSSSSPGVARDCL